MPLSLPHQGQGNGFSHIRYDRIQGGALRDEVQERALRHVASRSAWVCEAIRQKLPDRRKQRLMATWGTWLDDRTPEEILKEIKDVPKQRARASFD